MSSKSTYLYIFVLDFTCKRCLICTYFSPDSDETTFSLAKSKVKNILMMDLFITNMLLFTSQHVNVYVFSSSLSSHSDGTHLCQRTGEQVIKSLQICFNEETNSSPS